MPEKSCEIVPAGDAAAAARPGPARRFAVMALGSGCGAGFLPRAPGTWGSLVALALYSPLILFPVPYPNLYSLGGLLFFSVASLALGGQAELVAGRKDPRWFVLDEMAGVFLALFALAEYNAAPLLVGAAFLLFRLFDAVKVGAVGWIDRRLTGSVGILLDDLVAAAFAQVLVRGAAYGMLLLGLVSERAR
jgi:phosphatidylglycerophosphatase A